MWTTLIIATVFLVLLNIWIGLRRRAGDDLETFLSYKNQVGALPISLSLIGTIVGGGMFFTVGEMGYQAGVAPLSIAVSYISGFFLLGLIVKKIKELTASENIDTLYDLVKVKMNPSGNWGDIYRISMAGINCIVYFFLLAGQFLVLAAFYGYFFRFTGATLTLASVLVVGTSILVYSVLGGVKKDIATDVYQTIWVILVVIVTSASIFWRGHVFQGFEYLPKTHLNGLGYGVLFPIGVLLFYSPAFIGRYDFWQRVISSRDTRSAKKALWLSIPIILVTYCLFVYLGMFTKANAGDAAVANVSVLWALERIVPQWVFALVAVGLYAAVMSTADTLLNVSSVSLWKLWTSILKGRNANAPAGLRRAKSMAFIVGILSVLVVLIAKSVVTVVVGALSSVVIFTPSILYILFSRSPSGKAATISLLVPYLMFLVLFVGMPNLRMYAFVPGVILSSIILFVFLAAQKRI
jgi:SSS family solute:Na+ symporter